MLNYYLAVAGLAVLTIGIKVCLVYRSTTDLYRFCKARGPQMVKYIEWIFCRKGYELADVRYLGDLEIEALVVKNSVVTMVQIRQRKSKVTKTMVEFLYSVASKEDCDWAAIISPAGFRKDAELAARELGITLYGRRWLRNVLKGCRIKPEKQKTR